MAYFTKALMKIGRYRFEYYHKIEIESSWAKGDSATIHLPKMKNLLEDNLSAGLEVKIWGGYKRGERPLPLLFEGYISAISPKIPFEIKCEDRFYKLKRRRLKNKSWASITLKGVLNYVLNALNWQQTSALESYESVELTEGLIPDIVLSPFKLDNVTVAQALQYLADNYLITFYFRAGIDRLFVGLPYSQENYQDTPIFHFQQNIPQNGNHLEFKRAEDVKLKAKVVNIKKNNTKTEIEVGDPDGETRTIFLRSENNSEENLRMLAQRELEKLKYTGYRGYFEGFGTPQVIHSQTVSIQDGDYPQRAGTYLCDSVTTKFEGYTLRQKIVLGKSV